MDLTTFNKVAPYLTDPLVLIGFIFLLLAVFKRGVVKSGIIPPIGPRVGGRIIQMMLSNFFLLALAVVIFGFGVKFLEVYRESTPPVDVKAIVDAMEAARRNELARLTTQHEQDLRDWKMQAMEAVSALIKLRGEKDAPPGVHEALSLLKQGKTKAAEQIFREVAERKEREAKEAATAYRNLGALAFWSDTDRALSAYRRATELDPKNISGWNQLGYLLWRVGDHRGAETAYRKIEELGIVSNRPGWQAIAYGNLGNIYSSLGDNALAEELYLKSLEISEAIGDPAGMASIYGNLGGLYHRRGELTQAEAMHRAHLAVSKSLGDSEGIIMSYGNLGNIYLTQGYLGQAETMYREALRITEKENLEVRERTATVYTNLGILYQKREDLGQAEEMHRKSLAVCEAIRAQECMASALCNLGGTYYLRGDMAQAEEMQRKNLAISQSLGYRDGMAKAYGSLGLIYSNKDQLDAAETMYRESLKISETEDGEPNVDAATVYTHLGGIYRKRGDLEQAEAMYRKALMLFEKLGANPEVTLVETLLEKLKTS